MNQRAMAQRWPLVTAFTPWGFSKPEEKPTARPHCGRISACDGWETLGRTDLVPNPWLHPGGGSGDGAGRQELAVELHMVPRGAELLTVSVLASSLVK